MSEKDLDQVYSQRTDLFLLSMALAKERGWLVGARENDGQWVVLYIKMPTGEISIHAKVSEIDADILHKLPQELEWDGTNDEVKHKRIRDFVAQNLI